jgi:hypothetical protein
VREEWATERERLASAREEWELQHQYQQQLGLCLGVGAGMGNGDVVKGFPHWSSRRGRLQVHAA